MKIAALAATGPTEDELERSLAQAEAQFVYRLQTVGGFGGKSDQLNAYNVFLGEPGYFARDLARYREASPASIGAYARQYLQTDGAGDPCGRSARAERSGHSRSGTGGGAVTRVDRSRLPDLGPDPVIPLSRGSRSGSSRTGSRCGRSNTDRCRSSRSCCCSESGRRPILPMPRAGVADGRHAR